MPDDRPDRKKPVTVTLSGYPQLNPLVLYPRSSYWPTTPPWLYDLFLLLSSYSCGTIQMALQVPASRRAGGVNSKSQMVTVTSVFFFAERKAVWALPHFMIQRFKIQCSKVESRLPRFVVGVYEFWFILYHDEPQPRTSVRKSQLYFKRAIPLQQVSAAYCQL